jgi:hypothetical protein
MCLGTLVRGFKRSLICNSAAVYLPGCIVNNKILVIQATLLALCLVGGSSVVSRGLLFLHDMA